MSEFCQRRHFYHKKVQEIIGDIKVLARKASHAKDGSPLQDKYIAEIKVEKARLERNRADLKTHEATCEVCNA